MIAGIFRADDAAAEHGGSDGGAVKSEVVDIMSPLDVSPFEPLVVADGSSAATERAAAIPSSGAGAVVEWCCQLFVGQRASLCQSCRSIYRSLVIRHGLSLQKALDN